MSFACTIPNCPGKTLPDQPFCPTHQPAKNASQSAMSAPRLASADPRR
jgi:hypothetical protein